MNTLLLGVLNETTKRAIQLNLRKNQMGVLDLFVWMEASKANRTSRNSMKKIDRIAESINELQKSLQK